MKITQAVKIAFICVLVFISSCDKEGDGFNFGLISKENAIFEAIKRDEHLLTDNTYESSIANFAREEQQICIQSGLHKGQKQKSILPFKWVIDVPVDGDKIEKDIKGISELDALTAAELLSKELITLEINSQIQEINRYRLTRKGWAAATYDKRNGDCFYIGKASYLSIISVEKKDIPIGYGGNDTVYLVNVIAGFPKDFRVPDWANYIEVRKEFSVIDKLENGYATQVYMTNASGQWREYLSPSTIAKIEKAGHGRSENFSVEGTAATTKQFMIDSLKSPLYQKRHHRNCISLPGQSDNGVRVDQNMSAYNGLKYSVAIYDNQERSFYDDTESTTLPLLKRLVNAGVLTSEHHSALPGNSRDTGRNFSGTVFSLAPEYENIIDKEKGCVYLGPVTIEIVDVQIIPAQTGSIQSRMQDDAFKYKYIVMHTKPPEWAKDPVLQYWWPDLKGALENGMACSGHFIIDLKREHHIGAGVGSCWWAYDSKGML